MDGQLSGEVRARRGTAAAKPVSHNLNGQRLGRKGRDTRARILSAANELLATSIDTPVTLRAVARRAEIGLTSLYLYFADLTELLLALLEPLTGEAEEAYLRQLRDRWPDAELDAHCLRFVTAIHGFWQRNSMILHLRNSMSDQRDERMMRHRVQFARSVIDLLVAQMDHDPRISGTPALAMATVLYTGIERVVTVATDRILPTVLTGGFAPNVRNFLRAEARLLELGIRECRGAGGERAG